VTPPFPDTTLGSVLETLALERPDGDAVFHTGNRLSYSDLWSEVVGTAKALLHLGISRGSRVAILFANEPGFLVAALGAASIGAIVVPINTWYRSAEIRWTLQHSQAAALISTSRFLSVDYAAILKELIPELSSSEPGGLRSAEFPELRIVLLSDPPPGLGQFSWAHAVDAGRGVDDRQARKLTLPQDVALMMYTSGSTARPKGVQLQHGPLLRSGFRIGERRCIGPGDRLWLGSPLFYALASANAVPVALTAGAALVLQDRFEAAEAIELIRSTRATVYYGTGNMTRAILDHPTYSRAKVASLVKGTAGTVAEYKRLTLVEMGIEWATGSYGLTECYGHSTGHMIDESLERKLRTCGTALPEVDIKIVDPVTGKAREPNESGLILVRGHVTPGYFRDPEATARSSRADGYFDTGDLGLLDPDGQLVFHARLKDVIKSGGINVSPLEVEELLIDHPAVRDAHVVPVADRVRGELIVAFVDADPTLTESELRAFVRERAASFKVPHHIFVRAPDQLPRLASGKIARLRLQEEAENLLGPRPKG
jgi:fatty-acyl-CoA synthase